MIKAPGRNGKPTRRCFIWCGKDFCECNPGGAIKEIETPPTPQTPQKIKSTKK